MMPNESGLSGGVTSSVWSSHSITMYCESATRSVLVLVCLPGKERALPVNLCYSYSLTLLLSYSLTLLLSYSM